MKNGFEGYSRKHFSQNYVVNMFQIQNGANYDVQNGRQNTFFSLKLGKNGIKTALNTLSIQTYQW